MEESYVSQGVVFEILQNDCHQIQLLYGLYKHIIRKTNKHGICFKPHICYKFLQCHVLMIKRIIFM